jgi:hypothetical protein
MKSLQVTGPDLKREPYPTGESERLTLRKVYWEIAPDAKARTSTLDQVKVINYGEVPEGFIQVYPLIGSPEPAVERNLYCVSLVPSAGRGFTTFFSIRDGKILAEGEK